MSGGDGILARGRGKLASQFRGGKKNCRRLLGGQKVFKKNFLFQSQFNRYMLDLNRHVHSTLILWLYSGYIVFIHDNIVEYDKHAALGGGRNGCCTIR